MTEPADDNSAAIPALPLLEPRNPLLVAWTQAVNQASAVNRRKQLIAEFAFAVPDEPALEAIRDVSSRGVIEIGAGTGYWARLLHERGVDVVAFDTAPTPTAERRWFGATPPWFEVVSGDHTMVDAHRERTLLLVWPTRGEEWAADAVERFAAAGGTTVAYVGEPPGGRTGDDRFHALLGEIDRCWSCAYNFTTTPCLCGIRPRFSRTGTIDIPQWPGFEDMLGLYTRDMDATVLAAKPARARWHRRRARREPRN